MTERLIFMIVLHYTYPETVAIQDFSVGEAVANAAVI